MCAYILRSNDGLGIGTPGQIDERVEKAIPRVRAEAIGGDVRREENRPAEDRPTQHDQLDILLYLK